MLKEESDWGMRAHPAPVTSTLGPGTPERSMMTGKRSDAPNITVPSLPSAPSSPLCFPARLSCVPGIVEQLIRRDPVVCVSESERLTADPGPT